MPCNMPDKETIVNQKRTTEKKPLLKRIYAEIYEFAEAIVLICGNIIRGIWRTLMSDGRFRGRMIMILVYLAVAILASLLFDSKN